MIILMMGFQYGIPFTFMVNWQRQFLTQMYVTLFHPMNGPMNLGTLKGNLSSFQQALVMPQSPTYEMLMQSPFVHIINPSIEKVGQPVNKHIVIP
jgi:hypothetical protein